MTLEEPKEWKIPIDCSLFLAWHIGWAWKNPKSGKYLLKSSSLKMKWKNHVLVLLKERIKQLPCYSLCVLSSLQIVPSKLIWTIALSIETYSCIPLLVALRSSLVTGLAVFPFSPTDRACLTRWIEPSRDALQMECVSTLAEDYWTFITRILDSWRDSFESRLTNTANFIITSSIPSPFRDPMKSSNSNS